MIHLIAEDGIFYATFPFDPNLLAVVKGLPDGRKWEKGKKRWRVDPTPDNIRALHQVELDVGRSAQAVIDQWKAQRAELARLRAIRDADPATATPAADFKFITEPYYHQRVAFEWVRSALPGIALLLEQGTGKTKTAIDGVRWRTWKDGIRRVLVVCPKLVCWTWRDEIAMHSRIPAEKVQVLLGTHDSRVEMIARDQAIIDIINWDGLRVVGDELLARGYDMVIGDEITRIKNHKAQRTKVAFKLGDKARFRLALTGTPITNSLQDAFAIWRFIDGGQTFGMNFYAFRSRYFNEGRFEWTPKRDTAEAIGQRISRTSVQYKKAECLDLPPKVFQRVHCDLEGDQAKAYGDMVEDFIAELEGVEYRAEWAMTRVTKLSQIAAGFLMKEDPVTGKRIIKHFKKNPKADLVTELVEDLLQAEDKVIIWAHYRPSVELIAGRMMKYNPAVLYGGTKDGKAELDRFHDDPTCRVFIGNPATAGMGLTLTEASTAIYFENGYSAEGRWQSIDRIHRPGAEHHDRCLYIDVICRDTVDEDVLASLQKHENMASRVLDRGFFLDMLTRGDR